MPVSYAAASPVSRIATSTSFLDFATTSSMRPGWIRPSATSFSSERRATSRRTGSKHDMTTVSGVSSMIDIDAGRQLEGPDVAPFTPNDAALHSSSFGSATAAAVDSAVCSAAIR